MLHGAHTLASGATAEGAGVSGTFAMGDSSAALQSPRPAEQRAAIDALSPSVAPWVGARIGLGNENEAGLAYTGRAVRLDARHALEGESTAVSVGAGASAVLKGREEERASQGEAVSAPSGFGFDIPILVGWRSRAGVVTLLWGARVGFERLTFGDSAPGGSALERWYGGAILGLGIGFRHIHGVFEVDATYHNVSGSIGGDDVRFGGVTLSPATALVLTF